MQVMNFAARMDSTTPVETYDANMEAKRWEAAMAAAWQKIRDADAGKFNLDRVSSSAPTTADSLPVIAEVDDDDDDEWILSESSLDGCKKNGSQLAGQRCFCDLCCQETQQRIIALGDEEQTPPLDVCQKARSQATVLATGQGQSCFCGRCRQSVNLVEDEGLVRAPEASNSVQTNVVPSRPLVAPPLSGSPVWESRQRTITL